MHCLDAKYPLAQTHQTQMHRMHFTDTHDWMVKMND